MKALLNLVCGAAFSLLICTGAAGQATADCEELKSSLTRAQARLQDWPRLSRYSDANSKTGLPAKGEQRVVFMGDSITDLLG